MTGEMHRLTAGREAVTPPDGGGELRPVRVIDALHPDVTPPAMSVDGDFMTYSPAGEEPCGFLYKKTPTEAVYVLCGGRVIAGPLGGHDRQGIR